MVLPRPRTLLAAGAALAAAAGLLVAPPAAAASAPGFVDDLVFSSPLPTAVTVAPDGEHFVTSKTGQLRTGRPGGGLTTVLDVSAATCTDVEQGLLGVAVDDRHVFVYRTRTGDGCRNTVERYDRAPAGAPVDPASRRVLVDGIPTPGGNHNGGDVQLAVDGTLLVTTGDGGTDYAGDSGSGGANDAARDPHVLLGKVLRITTDGAVPADNPFADAPRCADDAVGVVGQPCAETWASGLRNPYRVAVDRDARGIRAFTNDVGQNAWEEIDVVEPGRDYGWNLCEGAHDNPASAGGSTALCTTDGRVKPPLWEYGHGSGCRSITGGAFVPPGAWPERFDGAYLFADFICGRIWALRDVERGPSVEVLTDDAGPVVHLQTAPDGALLYTTFARGGEVRRLAPAGAVNAAPTAALAGTRVGPGGTAVLDASGSTDPEAGLLTYEFDPGDGSAPVRTTDPTFEHVYAAPGRYAARLLVLDPAGATSRAAADVVVEDRTVRLSGVDRVATAVELSRDAFSRGGARVAVLARKDVPADALAVGPLASVLGGPLLLTGGDGLDPRVADELRRLDVDRVLLAGGTAALSAQVEQDAQALDGVVVERVAGEDRYGTAVAALRRRLVGADGEGPLRVDMWLALGDAPRADRAWPDALVASWAASTTDDVVLLVRPDALPDATRDALEVFDPTRVRLVGGTSAVSEDVADAAAQAAGVPVERLSGPTRYATGAAVVEEVGAAAGDRLFVATGRSFADALAAGPVAARDGTLVLGDGSGLGGSPAAADLLAARGPASAGAVLVGGEAALSARVEDEVAERVGR